MPLRHHDAAKTKDCAAFSLDITGQQVEESSPSFVSTFNFPTTFTMPFIFVIFFIIATPFVLYSYFFVDHSKIPADALRFQWVDWMSHFLYLSGGGLVLIFLICAILYFTAKGGKVAVFVSYFHKNAVIAKEVAEALSCRQIRVLHIPFDDYDYDEVISSVRKKVQSCDVVVSVPGPDRSFVDAEVFAASALRKPIIFIRADQSRLPDTAYTGYPVLNWSELRFFGLRHLVSLCLLVAGHVSFARRQIFRIFLLLVTAMVGIVFSAVPFIMAWDIVALLIWTSGYFVEAKSFEYSKMYIFLPLIVGVPIVAAVWRAGASLYVAKIMRQDTVTGVLTFDRLKGSFLSFKESIFEAALMRRAFFWSAAGDFTSGEEKIVAAAQVEPSQQPTKHTQATAMELAWSTIESVSGEKLRPFGFAISPSGKMLAVGRLDGTIATFDLGTGKPTFELKALLESSQSDDASEAEESNGVNRLAFSPDGQMLVAGQVCGRLQLWSLASKELLHQWQGHGGVVSGVAFASDGRSLYTSDLESTEIVEWSIEGGKVDAQAKARLKGHRAAISSLRMSPDGTKLISSGVDATVRTWSLPDGQLADTVRIFEEIRGFTGFACDWDLDLLATVEVNSTVRIWELSSRKQVRELNNWHRECYGALALSTDQRTLAVGFSDGTVATYDMKADSLVSILGRHQSAVHELAFVQDGNWIISTGEDGVRAWPAQGGANIGPHQRLTDIHPKILLRCLDREPLVRRSIPQDQFKAAATEPLPALEATPPAARLSVSASGTAFTPPAATLDPAPLNKLTEDNPVKTTAPSEVANTLHDHEFEIVVGDGKNDRTIRILPGVTVPKDASFAPEMVLVPPGTFWMGSRDGDSEGSNHERPRHEVSFGAPLLVSKYPITFEEWDAALNVGGVKYKPSDQGAGRGRRPVINVSWDDAKTFAAWLSQATSKSYRLLSEAEWEYACRAGTETAYSFGGAITARQAQFGNGLSGFGSLIGLAKVKTVEVGSFPPNRFGLHDMHGNVFEWCEDCYTNSYAAASTDGSKAPETAGCYRVVRGGSWLADSTVLRAAHRDGEMPSLRNGDIGFRLARTLTPTH